MVAWSAAHKLLPFFLGAVALFLVLLGWMVRDLPFLPGGTAWRIVGLLARPG